MFFQRKTFWLPKDLGHENEYQDAYALDARRGIVAIADGVSSSMFARRWAQILTRAIVADSSEESPGGVLDPRDPEQLNRWLAASRAAWAETIDTSTLAWHQKAKLRDGAFSTLLWMSLSPTTERVNEQPTYQLTAHSLGDCLLLHIRDDELLVSFPFDSPEQFDQTPYSLGSVPSAGKPQPPIVTLETTCQVGDLLVLCSDAFGAWALATEASDEPVDWHALWQTPRETWQEQIVQLRDAQQIRFDDTTLVILRLLDHTASPDGVELHPPPGVALDVDASSELSADKIEEQVYDLSDERWIDEDEDAGDADV